LCHRDILQEFSDRWYVIDVHNLCNIGDCSGLHFVWLQRGCTRLDDVSLTLLVWCVLVWDSSHWAKALYGDDPKNNGNFGRIVGDSQMKRLIGLLQTHGGKVVCGANYDTKARYEYGVCSIMSWRNCLRWLRCPHVISYIDPTVIQVDQKSPALLEETFGPILWVVPISDMDQAIRYVQARPKPLSLYIFSS